MLRNYVKIAFRNLLKQKGYAFINVFGLAVGMACCLLIFAFVRNERSYDRFHAGADRIYRVNIRSVTPQGGVELKAGQPYPLAPTMAATLPEVAAAVRLSRGEAVVRAEGTDAFPEGVVFTDPSFFDVFTFPLAAGTAADALARPASAVLTEAMARKYFGTTDVVGRRLEVSLGGAFAAYTVTAVAQVPPPNASLRFDLLLPLASSPSYAELETAWSSWAANTYVRLAETARVDALAEKLPAFTAQHYAPMITTARILGWIGEGEGAFQLTLQPLAEVHFTPGVQNALNDAIAPAYPYLLAGLALGVLLIACINFTTLALGRAARRAREVGLRKVMGAVRRQLWAQFWGEALLMSLLALVLGVAFAELLLPFFNTLTGKVLSLRFLYAGPAVLALAGLVLATGLVAGAYPALFLARFHPAQALRQGAGGGGRNRWMQALVVAQFTLSICFIVGVVVVSRQLDYLKAKDLGLQDEQLVVVPTQSRDAAGSERLLATFREQTRRLAGVVSVAGSSSGFNRDLAWRSYTSDEGAHNVFINRVDPAFVATLDLRLAAGRAFSDAYPGDATRAALVNEALVKAYGWEDPVGRTLQGFGMDGMDDPTVVGVVRDYHFTSLHQEVAPMVLFLGSPTPLRYLYVRVRPDDVPATVAGLRAAWERVAPGHPFDYTFLDEDFDRQYRSEEQWQRIITAASLFALLIACLGLFGLAAFTAERRTKEIGIRKVLGASAAGLVALLSRDFVKLVAVAFTIAAPVSYFAARRWLEGFAYRMELSWTLLAAAGLAALAAALLTVSYQALKAALTDPVKSLRYE